MPARPLSELQLERSSYHAVNSPPTASSRGTLVGDDGRWASPLLSLSTPLPHRRGPERILLHSQTRRRAPVATWLRTARRDRNGPDREEAAQSFFPRN